MANIFNLSAEHGEPIVFANGLPGNYRGSVLAGAACYSARSDLSELIVQELQGEEYNIRFIIGKFLRQLFAKGWIRAEGLYGNLMFKNSTCKTLVSLGEAHLGEGQYMCFYTQPSDCSSFFGEDKEFQVMDVFYSPVLLEELVPFFPELESIIGADPGVFITPKSFRIPITIKEITNQLLKCPYNETSRQFYFDLKVRELLYCMLENAFRQNGQLSFTPWEISRIQEAKEILLSHIASKPPSIRSLSKQVALNEYKLKKGFRQYYNTSISQWIHEQKLQHGRELILNTDKPIKEISRLVGYPLTTNFITAFRKQFGVTPGDLRRK
ncbi:MAG: AraC family transcriptional regulator [Chitinophagaceae bacterium]|nr:AraC family transcriptional regulator [Chitinophagaceae bacterium]